MINTNKAQALILSIVFPILVLLLIKLTYSYSCYFLIVPTIISFFIAYSFFEKKMREKTCFRNCYLKQKTFLARMVTSPYLSIFIYFILSIIYTISIVYISISFEWYFYLFLALFIFIVFFLYKVFLSLFSKTVNEEYLNIFVKEFTIKVSSLILFMFFISSFLYSYEPSYIKESLEESLSLATNYFSSNCKYLDYILRLKAELDTHYWFITKYSSRAMNDENINNIIWFSFIIANTISILGLSRFIVQVISISLNFIKKEEING